MRRTTFTLALSLFLAARALGLTYLGTPTATFRSGQWGAGLNYGYSSQNLRYNGQNANDAKWQTALATVDLGLDTNRAEVFGRLGLATAKWANMDWDTEFAAGLGARITTNQGEAVSWGVAAQGLWWQDQDSRTSIYEIEVGIGPCWQFSKGLLYGGPMGHFVTSNMDLKETSSLGAYVGGGYGLSSTWMLSGEVQWTPDAYGLSVGVQRRF